MKRLKYFLIALLITFLSVEAQDRSINSLPAASAYAPALRIIAMEDSSGVLVWRYSPWSALTNAMNDSVYSWFNTGTNFNITQSGGYNKLVLSLANSSVTSAHILNKTIAGASDIADESITSAQILNGTLTAADLGASSVGTSEITNGSIINEDYAANSITTDKILDGTITEADLHSSFSSVVLKTSGTYPLITGNYTYGSASFLGFNGDVDYGGSSITDYTTDATLYLPLLSSPPSTFRKIGFINVTPSEGPGDYRLAIHAGAANEIDTLATLQDLRNIGGGGTGSSTLLGLADVVPATYVGAKGKPLIVNTTQNGMIFGDYPVKKLFDLEDFADTSFVGKAGFGLTVNTGETGAEFIDLDIPRYFTSLNDAPTSFAGHDLDLVRVNSAANALEFVPMSALPLGGGDEDTVAILIDSVSVTNTELRKANSTLETIAAKGDTLIVKQEEGEILQVSTEDANARSLYTGVITNGTATSEAIKVGHKRILAIEFTTSGTLQMESFSFTVSLDGTNYSPYHVDNALYTVAVTAKSIVYYMDPQKMAPLNDFKIVASENENSTVTCRVWAGGGF